MRRLPWLTAAIAITILVLVALVPAAMAKPGNGNGDAATANAAVASTAAEGKHGGKVCANAPSNPHCYPVSPGGQLEFRPCKDNSPPPCARGKDYSEPLGTAIPTGVAFLGLGALVLGYLGWHRRQTLRLST